MIRRGCSIVGSVLDGPEQMSKFEHLVMYGTVRYEADGWMI